MNQLTLLLVGLNNGTWVSTGIIHNGASVTAHGPGPADAACATLQLLGIDNLSSFVEKAKEERAVLEQEIELLRNEYHVILQSISGIQAEVRAIAGQLNDDWEGKRRREIVAKLQRVVEPWPQLYH